MSDSQPPRPRLGDDGEIIDGNAPLTQYPEKPKRGQRRHWSERGWVRALLILPFFGIPLLAIGGVFLLIAFSRPYVPYPSLPPTFTPVLTPRLLSPSITPRPVTPIPTGTVDPDCTANDLNEGNRIAFISDQTTPFGAIHVVNVQNKRVCLWYRPSAGVKQLSSDPDGRGVIYESNGSWLLLTSGGAPQPLTTPPPETAQRNNAGVTVYDDVVSSGFRAIFSKAGDAAPIKLTAGNSRDFSPVWSPDGTQIVFVSYRTSNNELFAMNADGSALRRLTDRLASDSSPVWLK